MRNDDDPQVAEVEQCTFDDIQGRGNLLGLEIVTDSILDPRRDRVIPLWPEEQGLTVAIAKPIFSRVRTMVDLGAGSGVFSLAAASQGCRVLAVETSPRALAFLALNAARNSILCRDAGEEVGAGEIGSALCRLGDENRGLVHAMSRFGRAGADLVMLNAPYHPTIPGIDPATHARAGEFGQSAFSEFIQAR